MTDLSFYRGKRVLVTGHTGFKGSWLCKLLLLAGARVTGYSLAPPTDPSLFVLAGLERQLDSVTGDVRDFDHLLRVTRETGPELVFHLAAQPIVREGYAAPRYTYETNVMGTVNLLECVRLCPGVKSVVNVTTDKVYRNPERGEAFREEEPLDGYDPYSSSKSCSELVTAAYVRSFFGRGPAVSAVRAGNVIGGGDFAKDRILPDCVRAAAAGRPAAVRNPRSVRPYQHVLEPLAAYLMIAEAQYRDRRFAGAYNVGPEESGCVTTGRLADLFCRYWGHGAAWEDRAEPGAPHEAGFLRLDCTKLKETFGWRPRWDVEKAVEMTCAFSRIWLEGGDLSGEMEREILMYFEG